MPRTATVRAETGGEVLRLERERFVDLLKVEPAIGVAIAANLGRRLRERDHILLDDRDVTAQRVEGVLARLRAEVVGQAIGSELAGAGFNALVLVLGVAVLGVLVCQVLGPDQTVLLLGLALVPTAQQLGLGPVGGGGHRAGDHRRVAHPESGADVPGCVLGLGRTPVLAAAIPPRGACLPPGAATRISCLGAVLARPGASVNSMPPTRFDPLP